MSASDFAGYVESQRKASLLAQRDFEALWERLKGMPPESARNALLVAFPALVDRYAGMAALAAAEYYEAERAQAGGDPSFRAELAETVPMEQMQASVRFACGHLFGGDGDGGGPESDASLFGG